MRRLGTWLGLAAACAWSLAPFAWQVLTSVKPQAELESLPPLLPSTITLVHYEAVFAGHPFAHLLLNSFAVAACATALALALGSLAGFALAKLRPPGRAATLAAVVVLSMLPPVATVSPLFLLAGAAGLRDTLTGLALVYAGFALPLAVWLMAQFFRSVPDDLYIAARVDGCSLLGAFGKVMLPLAVPGLTATGLLVFVFCWNEFLFALTLTSSTAARTVPVGIALFPGIHEVPWGEIAAASVVATAPLVLLAAVFQRRVLDGLTAGAVKG
ncbi:MAG: sugar ABC transporter permease [Betaproteobacteria bacterium RIFCSPLOWO2_12_FULL_68_19]|nr:MAG: sugar ABC transporter permease [Betaproteobacteria bacterium RIFCSPLOWO2_12_FULL_68_19]